MAKLAKDDFDALWLMLGRAGFKPIEAWRLAREIQHIVRRPKHTSDAMQCLAGVVRHAIVTAAVSARNTDSSRRFRHLPLIRAIWVPECGGGGGCMVINVDDLAGCRVTITPFIHIPPVSSR